MIRPSARVLSLLTAILFAAACGSSNATSSGSTPTPTPTPTPNRSAHVPSADACTLVTSDEASAAVGSQVTNLGASGGAQIPGACIYGASGSTSVVFVFAQVYPDATAADAVQPDQIAAAMAGQLSVSNAHAVTGIGDKAFEYTTSASAGGGIAIFVFKYNVVLLIAVSPTTDASKVEGLARTAVNRLVPA